jgi:hypothetical protein
MFTQFHITFVTLYLSEIKLFEGCGLQGCYAVWQVI